MTRCFHCKKTLSIVTERICKCENKFCAKHVHAESHVCTFDYKKPWREKLRNQNKPVIPKKVSDI